MRIGYALILLALVLLTPLREFFPVEGWLYISELFSNKQSYFKVVAYSSGTDPLIWFGLPLLFLGSISIAGGHYLRYRN